MDGSNRTALAWRGGAAACALSFCLIAPLHAATLDIGATVAMTANLTIEDGSAPDDIDVALGVVTDLIGDASSMVDDATATGDESRFTQVGLVTTPRRPYIDTASNETRLPDGGAARGFFYVESLIRSEFDVPLDPTVSNRVLNGTATLAFPDLGSDASAAGGYDIGRDLILTNTSTTMARAFSIAADFDIALSASADEIGSSSRAEAFFTLAFITTGEVALSLAGPFDDDTGISASDPGTTAATDLVTSNALFDGVVFSASAAATGTGAPTLATVDTTSLFVMDARMDPGATMRVRFFQAFDARSGYDHPDMPPVPLPAGLVLLLSGLGALGVARRARR
jgi:hypothetical protein